MRAHDNSLRVLHKFLSQDRDAPDRDEKS